MKNILFSLFLLFAGIAAAQNGKVEGVLTDADTGELKEPVAFASVVLKGTNYGAQSDIDGKFSIPAPAGTYTLVVSFVGMKTVEVPDVIVRPGFTTTVDVPMSAEAASLDAVSITVAKSRASTAALLDEKKKAVTIVQSIGAEELSQKGVSDAEGAVTKVSGVSKQSGVKNVFVRGLGDRYNSTTLNGLPLPSEDPEYKNLSLDFFSSDLIESVDINKVFVPGLTGDNAGANINIDLKGLTGRSALAVGVSTGFNSLVVGEDFKNIDGEGFFGFSDTDFPINSLSEYGFENNLAPEVNGASPNVSFDIAGGKRFDIGDDYLNVSGLLSFNNGYRILDRTVRNTNSAGDIFFDIDGTNFNYDTSQIAMLDLDYRLDKGNIELISLYIHKNTQSLQEYFGQDNPEQLGDQIFLRRQQTNNNNLYINQLLGNFELTPRLELNLKGSINIVRSAEPDRRDFEYLLRDGFFSPNIDSGGDNQRYFSQTQENDWNGIASLNYDLNSEDDDSDLLNYVVVGVEGRYTRHAFDAIRYDHTFNNRIAVDTDNPDEVYNQGSLNGNVFRFGTGRGTIFNPGALDPFVYDGQKANYSGYGQYVNALSEKFLINVGARFESVEQLVTFNTNIANSNVVGDSRIQETFFLPSVNLKYSINEKNILRAAASTTYMMPRFKEVAPFRYDGVQFSIQGNPDLEISNIGNLDLAYEFYPSKGELISVGAFYKRINDPVSRVEIPSAGNTLTYLNVGDQATVLGVELEVRKDLFKKELAAIGQDDEIRESKLSSGLNISYLNSEMQLDDPQAQFSEENTELQGAAPLLVNFDLNLNTYLGKNNLNTAVVFNYFTERVFSVGTRGFDNILEIGVPTLDLISSLKVGENGTFNFKARNLLNPEIRLERDATGGNVVLSEYKRGLDFSVGYSYKF